MADNNPLVEVKITSQFTDSIVMQGSEPSNMEIKISGMGFYDLRVLWDALILCYTHNKKIHDSIIEEAKKYPEYPQMLSDVLRFEEHFKRENQHRMLLNVARALYRETQRYIKAFPQTPEKEVEAETYYIRQSTSYFKDFKKNAEEWAERMIEEYKEPNKTD
jgi:hypothetical protein